MSDTRQLFKFRVAAEMSGTGLRYRTPLEVRSIPNGLWDEWIRADRVPWATFAATRDVQTTLRHVVRSAVRRAEAYR